MTRADSTHDQYDATLLIPVHEEERALPVTLPAVAREMEHAGVRVQIVVVLTPGRDRSPALVRGWARSTGASVVISHEPSKARALELGLLHARAPLLILMDADVVAAPGTLAKLLAPATSGKADVVFGRPVVARRHSAGLVASLLRRWAVISFEAWHRARLRDTEVLWAIPGYLYVIRKCAMPSCIAMRNDDAFVGLHARRFGARFEYVPDATVSVLTPDQYRDWLRQKLRVRLGWLRVADIAGHEVVALKRALSFELAELSHTQPLAVASLVLHDWGLRALVRFVGAVLPRAIGLSWEGVKSTKCWSQFDGDLR